VRAGAAHKLGASDVTDPVERRMVARGLAAAMRDPELAVRAEVSAAVVRLHSPVDVIVGGILEVLRRPTRVDDTRVDERVITDAVAVLFRFGAEAKAAAPELAGLLYWDRPVIVDRATAALMAIGPDAAPPLIVTLAGTDRGDDERLARCRAAAVLADLYPCGEPTIAALTKALQDRDESVRIAAAGALGSCAPRPASVRPALAAALKDPSAHVRREALRAWTALDPGANAAGAGPAPDVPALLTVLKGADNPARAEAASALASIGPPAAAQALPSLTRMADNRQAYLRRAAAVALAKLDPEGRGLAPALVAAVKNADPEAGAILVAAVRRSPDRAEAARRMDALSREDSDQAVRDEAARTAKDLQR
jgi:HEAT repeat protein